VFEKDPTPEGACTSPVGVLEGGEGSSLGTRNMAHLVAEIFRYRAGDKYVRPELEFPAGQAPYRGKRPLSRTRGIMKVAWFGVIAFLNAPQAMVTERSRMQVVAVAQARRLGTAGEICKDMSSIPTRGAGYGQEGPGRLRLTNPCSGPSPLLHPPACCEFGLSGNKKPVSLRWGLSSVSFLVVPTTDARSWRRQAP
jgi:hypothetical protein